MLPFPLFGAPIVFPTSAPFPLASGRASRAAALVFSLLLPLAPGQGDPQDGDPQDGAFGRGGPAGRPARPAGNPQDEDTMGYCVEGSGKTC